MSVYTSVKGGLKEIVLKQNEIINSACSNSFKIRVKDQIFESHQFHTEVLNALGFDGS